MIHMARLPTPQDPASENVAPSEATSPAGENETVLDFTHEEHYQAFLEKMKQEQQSVQISLDPKNLFERLNLETKDFIKDIRGLNNTELSTLLMYSSKIVKDNKNFDHAYTDAFLDAEKRDFRLNLIIRGIVTVGTAGLLSLTGPGAAVGFVAVMCYIQGSDLLERQKRSPEFALTRLALLEQESLKRKLLAKKDGEGLVLSPSEEDFFNETEGVAPQNPTSRRMTP